MIIPDHINHLNYTTDQDGNQQQMLNEDYIHWLSEDSDERLMNLTSEELIKLNKFLRILIQSKNETIKAKDEKITTLEQLIVEIDNSSKLKDTLIAQLLQKPD